MCATKKKTIAGHGKATQPAAQTDMPSLNDISPNLQTTTLKFTADFHQFLNAFLCPATVLFFVANSCKQ